ncbi:MAG: sigma-54 dependent transcriptional regulator [Candidatus Ozemobacteraceae bacterium]
MLPPKNQDKEGDSKGLQLPGSDVLRSPSPSLLLPLGSELFLVKSEAGLLIERIPEWLAQALGTSSEGSVGTIADTLLEPAIPGVAELARSVILYKKPVSEYQSIFVDRDGTMHGMQISAVPVELSAGRCGVALSMTIQDAEISPSLTVGLPGSKAAGAMFHGMVGASAAMRRVFNKIRLYGAVDAPVLVTGETGAGKEGVARALHEMSLRSSGPFEAVNCSAITETLFESEFFGHEKGSFTGAIKTHKGRFERAHGGTLFLDEVGDLPPAFQTKLLRVIESETIDRVGSERSVKVDVRLVAATNRNLEEDIARRAFRADLFYRIGALQICIPSLRERIEDIPLLVDHFIMLLNKKYDRHVACLTPEALHLLKQYQWPGNVRELRNLMERLFAENSSDIVGIRALGEWYEERVKAGASRVYDPNVTVLPYRPAIALGMGGVSGGSGTEPRMTRNGNESRMDVAVGNGSKTFMKIGQEKMTLDEQTIRQAFKDAGGNMTRAASILGIHKATLYRTLKTLNLDRSNLG